MKNMRSCECLQGETVRMSLPGLPEFVSLARLTVAAVSNLIGFSIEEVEDLQVAVSEACTNALRHGCTKDECYDLYYTLEKDKLTISVEDKGNGYEPELVSEPELPGDQAGGFGLFIIKSLMDEVEVISNKGVGTNITMVKYLRN
ncbi:MAG: ATP-binding protein [Eubacterium sp.]